MSYKADASNSYAAKCRSMGVKHRAKGGRCIDDLRQDVKIVKKAMHEHDMQLHGGKHTKLSLTKRAHGGKVHGKAAGGRLDRRRHGNINIAIIGQKGGASPQNPVPMAGGPAMNPMAGAAGYAVPRPMALPPQAGGAPGRPMPGMKKGGRVRRRDDGGAVSDSSGKMYDMMGKMGKSMSSPNAGTALDPRSQKPASADVQNPYGPGSRGKEISASIPGKNTGGPIGGKNYKYPHMTAGARSGVGRMQMIGLLL
jgi:hypothetical protein